jgi:hypothetical protein
MSSIRRATRRTALKLGAAATALPLVHIRSAGAAGRLNVALWDHWVPTADPAMKKLAVEWGKQNQVDVTIDFLTEGAKITSTMAAEAKAKAGHDIFCFDVWTVQQYAGALLPVDDVMQSLIAQYGKLGQAFEYLGMAHGHWLAVPVSWGSLSIPPCARISLLQQLANVDVQSWYPAHESTPEAAKDWTYDKQLEIAEASFKAGYPIGFGCGPNSGKATGIWGTTFGAFGAELVDAKGNIAVESDNVTAVMEYCARLVKFMPADAPTWTDPSSNRALISGKTTMIWNPPSAWVIAKHYNPKVAQDCWTFPNPRGPQGRLVPHRPIFWGIWSFAKNPGAAKDFIAFMSQREQVETLATAAEGYDIPPFESMSDLKIWSEVEPPKGTLYNYPMRRWHQSTYYIPGSSAPTAIAARIADRAIYPGMVARLMSGQTIRQSIDWAKSELELIVR